MQLFVDSYSNAVLGQNDNFLYNTDRNMLVAENGTFVHLDLSVHRSINPRTEAIYIYNYMKRRVFEGDIVCSINNIGTKFEQWWPLQGFTPDRSRALGMNGMFSCRTQDCIPYKYLAEAEELFEDTHEYEQFMMQITSLVARTRMSASVELAKRLTDYYPDKLSLTKSIF